jgi:translation initiation factor 4G
MKAEFTADSNEEELLLTMDELASTPNAGQTLVQINTDAAMDCKDAEREVIIEMLSILAEKGKLSRSDFETPVGELVEFIDSFVIDSPRAFQYLGDMLAEFIRVKVLDVPWLCRQCAKLKDIDPETSSPEKLIGEVIESMKSIEDVGVDGAKTFFGTSGQAALETLLGADKWSVIAAERLA